MAGTIALADSGTDTAAALNTPLEISSLTLHGVYVLEVDLANLAAAETVRFTATNGAGVVRLLGTYTGVQTPAGDALGPVVVYPAEAAVSLKLEQTAGTLRAFPWVLKRIYDDTVSG